MQKKFNITGICIPEKHYMVNISNKIEQILPMVEEGEYFVINKPRQYGKTTNLWQLTELLNKREDYLAIFISFEGLGNDAFSSEKYFYEAFIELVETEINNLKVNKISKLIYSYMKFFLKKHNISKWISHLVRIQNKKMVLIIDEVDKCSNNEVFINFLGMLRDKYLKRTIGKDITFHSVILAGVHDVKNLKLKIRPDSEQKFNSPWNIAADFNIDFSFNPDDISTLLLDYSKDQNIQIDIKQLSEKIYYYTSGYPFLVSKLCKIMAEKLTKPNYLTFHTKLLDKAVNLLLSDQNTNFDSLIKNLENNSDLYSLIVKIILDGVRIDYNKTNNVLIKGIIYGILKDNGYVKIHNRIYEQIIYNHIIMNLQINDLLNSNIENYNCADNFKTNDNYLNFEIVLLKFQNFMKYEYSLKDKPFLERNGRLIFLAFLKPIINGYGFDFKEVQISEEKRLDVIITWLDRRYLVELKIWRGQEAHKKGIKQLCDYMDRINLNKGYLIIYDFRKTDNKDWKNNTLTVNNKKIFMVWI